MRPGEMTKIKHFDNPIVKFLNAIFLDHETLLQLLNHLTYGYQVQFELLKCHFFPIIIEIKRSIQNISVITNTVDMYLQMKSIVYKKLKNCANE